MLPPGTPAHSLAPMVDDLARAVQTVVHDCLAVQADEDVVIVGDASTVDIAIALRDEAERAGADATLLLVTARQVDGEGFISPTGGDGVLYASSLAAIGLATPPARLTVADGRLFTAEGDAGARLLERLRAAGELGTNLAELGVGTNERATLTGNIPEDEKMLGTVHVAFGASAGIGGTVTVPVHLDVLVVDPTLTLDGTTVIDAGRFSL